MNKRNYKLGFTLVELLAVIVILAVILVIAVPQIMNVIDSATDGSFISTAKLIADGAEREYVLRETLGTLDQENNPINCSDVTKLLSENYDNCTINFLNKKAYVTIDGLGKFNNKHICNKNKNNISVTNTNCNEREKEELKGSMVQVTDAEIKDSDIRIFGSSIQNGEPTPDSPVPVVSLGETSHKLYIKSTGKNLFDISKITKGYTKEYKDERNDYIDINEEIITSNTGVYGDSAVLYDSKMYLDAGTYTISCDAFANKDSGNKEITIGVRDLDTSKYFRSFYEISSYKIWKNFTYTFTLTNGANIAILVQSLGQAGDFTNLNIQFKNLYLGKNISTEIDLAGHEPLRCIGDVCDYIDYNKGGIVRNIGKVELNGSNDEDWLLYNKGSEGTSFFYSISSKKVAFKTSLSTHYVNIMCAWSSANINNYGIYSDHDNNTNVYFRAPNSSVTTIEEFRNWLSAHQTMLYYVFATSTDPDDEQIDLPDLNIHEGINNISVSDGRMFGSIYIGKYKD